MNEASKAELFRRLQEIKKSLSPRAQARFDRDMPHFMKRVDFRIIHGGKEKPRCRACRKKDKERAEMLNGCDSLKGSFDR
jgi:hypothetical protein